MERALDNESFGIAEAGGNFGVPPTKRPKVLPGLPRGDFGVHDRAPGDVKPNFHPGGDQVVANLFSCIHSWLQNFGPLRAGFPFLGLCRHRGTRLSKANDLAFASSKILFFNIGSESRRIARSVGVAGSLSSSVNKEERLSPVLAVCVARQVST